MSTEVYSSVHLRERDKLLLDKHQKEVAILEKKLQKVKAISDETAKQLFDAVNRGRKLAQSLGFDDVYDAQFAIDSVDHDITFHECYDRLHQLDDQLSAQKQGMATLETKLHNAEEKIKELQIELAADSRSTESNLREQLRRLNEQYDALKDVKERAAERYKADFKKWRAFNDWLIAEKCHNESGISHGEKKRRYLASMRRKMMIEIGPDLARFEGEPENASTNAERPPPLGCVELYSDKENAVTPMPQYKKRRISTTPNLENVTSSTAKRQNNLSAAVTPPVLSRNNLLKSVTNMAAPASSPPVFINPSTTNIGQPLTTRVPLTFQPIPTLLHMKEKSSLMPSSVNNTKSNASLQQSPTLAKQLHMPNSSDTEDDSQAIYIPISGTPEMNGVFKVPTPPQPSNSLRIDPIQPFGLSIQPQLINSSNVGSTQHKLGERSSPAAEDDLSRVPPPGVTVHPSLSCRPAFTSSSRHIHSKARLPLAAPMRGRESNWESNRPAKVRRLTGDEFGRSDECIPRNESDSIINTPSIIHPRRLEALGNDRIVSAKKDKGKSREAQNEFSTPATTRTNGQKRIEDYSVFKGRGRYGKGAENNQPGDTTINAQYTIDPNGNEGLNYQYDLVVRNREERRRLEGGDCECCREYYEGIGPLPSRLQAPLWCSPPPTPVRPCLRQSHSQSPEEAQHLPRSGAQDERRPQADPTPGLRRQSDVESHKKAISRHRHTWARPNTPPGYWDIGFPDTQAVGDINEKAKQMHKRKKAEIDKETRNEGRYRRR